MSKSLFQSKTIWGASIALAAALVPAWQALAAGDVPDVVALTEALVGFIGAVVAMYGRYTADSTLYTPHWLPGRNAKDILSETDILGRFVRGAVDAESTWGDADPND